MPSCGDFELEVVNLLLDIRLGELLNLLYDDHEVLAHLCTLGQSLLVARLIVFKETLKDLFSVAHLREAKSRVAPLNRALALLHLVTKLVDQLLSLAILVNVREEVSCDVLKLVLREACKLF